jgi:hypothetical protein
MSSLGICTLTTGPRNTRDAAPSLAPACLALICSRNAALRCALSWLNGLGERALDDVA